LRQRAAGERYKHRRQRLTAFADLKDGSTVVAAAAVVGVLPRSVYGWLGRGAERGLEAALERPTGKSALTSAQAEALAQWIAADRPHQNRRRIVDRAAVQFGVALSLAAASKLLAKHGRAKPGRRHRLWRPTPRRQVVAGSTHDPAPGL
jgi:transposase